MVHQTLNGSAHLQMVIGGLSMVIGWWFIDGY
jgi:hypothetical protein